MAGLGVLAASLTVAAGPPDDVWAPAGALPGRLDAPVFALAVDPATGAGILAGTASGSILRSADGGGTWVVAASHLGRGVAAVAFDPTHPGVVLAGTRGAGVWRSVDGGATWRQQPGGEQRTVRAFAFLGPVALAGGDQGVMSSREGGPWRPAGLPQVRVSALAVGPGPDAAPLAVAGGDATRGAEPLPLFVSPDGQTWSIAAGADVGGAVAGSSMVTALAPPSTAGGPLLMGTNSGLFASSDAGATWQQLTGSGELPGLDFTGVSMAASHPERLYAASDGGGSNQGGLWVSGDAGAHFTALTPPEPVVTALAVSADDTPELVVATFRPSDHAVALWTYHDAGGQPAGVVAGPATTPAAQGTAPPRARHLEWRALLDRPELPYAALGAAALLTVVAGLALSVRRR